MVNYEEHGFKSVDKEKPEFNKKVRVVVYFNLVKADAYLDDAYYCEDGKWRYCSGRNDILSGNPEKERVINTPTHWMDMNLPPVFFI